MRTTRIEATDCREKKMPVNKIALLTLLACLTTAATMAAGQTHLTAVSLKVTVNTSQQFDPLIGNPTYVTPDSLGQYIDGQNGVCANLDTSGDLIINFDCKSSATPRRVGMNLSAFLAPPTSGTDVCSPPNSISPTNPPVAYTDYVATLPATDKPAAAFQSMAVYDGTAATIYYVQFFVQAQFSDAEQTIWRLNYHRTQTFADAALASYAEVRRMSSTQWVVEPVTPSGLATNPPNVAMLVWVTSTRNRSATTECGFYQAPFSFTLDQN
jgi:hypothetical protein